MTPPACDSYRVNQLDSLRFGLFGVGYQSRLLLSGDAYWWLNLHVSWRCCVEAVLTAVAGAWVLQSAIER